MQQTSSRPRATSEPSSLVRSLVGSPATAVSVIWVSVVVCAVFGPDMVTGSAHERIPLASLTVWVWATVATAFLSMGARRSETRSTLVVGTSAIWGVVLVAVLAAPSLVTGTDPTTIPLTALLAPVAGAVATGFLALAGCPTRR
jgi:hypothetical protein